MRWEILTVGRPSFSWVRAGSAEYEARLRRMATVEVRELRVQPAGTLAGRMLEASSGAWRVVLDERGRSLTSLDFAGWIRKQELQARKRVCVLIGGAEGHDPTVRGAADEVWSLSPLTLQHEMVRVLFLEQLYRAFSILRGEPYHRA